MAGKRAKQPAKKRKARRKVVYDGTTFLIPTISKGRQTTKEEKIKIADLVCRLYATDQFTLENCLQTCGVKSDATWITWVNQIEEIEELYQRAKEIKSSLYQIKLSERARDALERSVSGYTVTTIDTIKEMHGEELKTTHQREKQTYVKPSPTLIQMALYNSDPQNFSKDPEQRHKFNQRTIPSGIQVEIINEWIPPVTSEDDIIDDFD